MKFDDSKLQIKMIDPHVKENHGFDFYKKLARDQAKCPKTGRERQVEEVHAL